jgi:hypothetical protein
MSKFTHSTTKRLAIISLVTAFCSAWALAPLWLNPCIHTHLNEEEIGQIRAMPEYKKLTSETQAEYDHLYREEEIPCGAQDLPLLEKLEASRFQGLILRELEILRFIVLRVEFTGILENSGLYHYKGYTFFFIPIFDAVGGGSGYTDIRIWSLPR